MEQVDVYQVKASGIDTDTDTDTQMQGFMTCGVIMSQWLKMRKALTGSHVHGFLLGISISVSVISGTIGIDKKALLAFDPRFQQCGSPVLFCSAAVTRVSFDKTLFELC